MSYRVLTLVCHPKYLLVVCYTPRRAFQWQVVDSQGQIRGDNGVFYSEEAALRTARCWLARQRCDSVE